ncbi:hypothetical protein [Candidatus Marimicrobium litorale]|uniref:Uncharacterized protein n=1 Tax=Candidatus Marimicrobium litorale TaxID=2518991 RepID=A0ABT3T9I1_9GAMM|nr:hypothetical protein [Candidatus Marimicrobium litorale]MCX2978840.1 hypothetical protein [Candidatus Marimicrobium litorale]
MRDSFVIYSVIVVLFSLMASRACRSASAMDYVLATTQGVGLLLLMSNYRQIALYLLLTTAVAYWVSQILTGARPISRLLPIAGAGALVFALMIPAG